MYFSISNPNKQASINSILFQSEMAQHLTQYTKPYLSSFHWLDLLKLIYEGDQPINIFYDIFFGVDYFPNIPTQSHNHTGKKKF